jgi:hypothetical protein
MALVQRLDTSRQHDHFRFLDLPAELHSMVYDHLDVQTAGESDAHGAPTVIGLTLIRHHVSTQVLRVCHSVRDEAQKQMMQKLQDIREMTPNFIVDKTVVQSLPRSNDIFTLIIGWLLSLETNKQIRFGEWMTHLTNRGDVAFTQMPDAMLRFAEQAGIQMLNRWQKEGYCTWRPVVGSGFASVFFALRFQNTLSLACDIPATQVQYIKKVNIPSDGRDWALGESLYWNMNQWTAAEDAPVENIIQWNVIVEAGQKGMVRNVGGDLWEFLGLNTR